MRYGAYLLAMALTLFTRSGAAADASTVDRRLDQPFGEHEPYQRFLTDLQKAVAAEARGRVAYMVSYPLRARMVRIARRSTRPHSFWPATTRCCHQPARPPSVRSPMPPCSRTHRGL
jgi:hypothetical protein